MIADFLKQFLYKADFNDNKWVIGLHGDTVLDFDPEQQLKEIIKEIIGDDIDTQALVQAKEREKAKHAFTVNETKEAQRLRLCKAFGIEIPEMSHRELREWLKELK